MLCKGKKKIAVTTKDNSQDLCSKNQQFTNAQENKYVYDYFQTEKSFWYNEYHISIITSWNLQSQITSYSHFEYWSLTVTPRQLEQTGRHPSLRFLRFTEHTWIIFNGNVVLDIYKTPQRPANSLKCLFSSCLCRAQMVITLNSQSCSPTLHTQHYIFQVYKKAVRDN